MKINMPSLDMLPPEMLKEMERCNKNGKQLALRMMDLADMEDLRSIPTIVHALAFMFAGLLMATDGENTAYEEMGYGLLGDDQRLALFCHEVKTMVAQMRESKPKSEQPRTM